MNQKEIRWRQRFENFEKSFLLLEQSLGIGKPSVIERAGIIQFFEITFELSWKLLKDYLTTEGYEITSPREAIKQAFQSGLIKEGTVWLMALEDRNLTTHTYDEKTALRVEKKIRESYFPLLKELRMTFKAKVADE